jgi:hypothetical protein
VRISTKVVVDITSGEVLHREAYDYSGPIVRCCGGPTSQQTAAANNQLALSNEMMGIYAPAATAETGLVNNLNTAFTTGQAETEPFYSNLLENGLPYFSENADYSSSAIGQQEAQAQAQLKQRMASGGSNLPNGYEDQLSNDLSTNYGEAFDQNMLALLNQNQAAKMAGAQGLNPIAYASTAAGANSGLLGAGSTAVGGNQSVMNAPLQNSFWSNLLGGILGAGGELGSAALFA